MKYCSNHLLSFKKALFIPFFALLIFSASPGLLRADLFYWPSEYNFIYNEKVALELELKSLKTRFANEKANYESRIKELESRIEDLNGKIALMEKTGEKVMKAELKTLRT